MKRHRLPDLSHILDSSAAGVRSDPEPQRGMPAVPVREQRIHTRFDKAFLVVVGSELYGDSFAIARNVSSGGILVEMPYAPPLGTVVTVHFQHVRLVGPAGDTERTDELVVRAEVKHHHYLNFTGSGDAASTRAIGMRFLEFVDSGERIDPIHVH